MSEITVIKQDTSEERVLSKDERDVLFKQISSKLNIPYYYLEELGLLEDEIFAKESKNIKPDITSLLVRKLLEFTNVIPIIKELKVISRTPEEFIKEYNMMSNNIKGSGPSKPAKNPKKSNKLNKPLKPQEESKDQKLQEETSEQVQEPKDQEKYNKKNKSYINAEFGKNLFYVPIQVLKPQPVVVLNELDSFLNSEEEFKNDYLYKVAQNDVIEICGLIVDQSKQTTKYYVDDVYNIINVSARIKSGEYSNSYLWDTVFSPYNVLTDHKIYNNLNNISINNGKLNIFKSVNKSSKLLYLLFNSDEQTKKVSNALFDLMNYYSKYSYNDYIANYINLSSDLSAGKSADLPSDKPANKKQNYSELFSSLVELFKNQRSQTKKSVNIKDKKDKKDNKKQKNKNSNSDSESDDENIVDVSTSDSTESKKPKELSNLKTPAIRKFFEDLEKEKLFMGNFSFVYDQSIWNDLISIKATSLLEKLMFIYNDKSILKEQKTQYEKDIQDFLNKKRQDLLVKAYQKYLQQIYEKNILHEMKLRHIYIQKFGYEKYKEIVKKMPVYGTMRSMVVGTKGSLFDYITDKEIKVVEAEMSKQQKMSTKSAESAPWANIVNNIRTSTSKKDRLKYYNELKQYLPNLKGKDMSKEKDLIMSKDDVAIICPHVKAMLDLEENNATTNDIRNELLKFTGDVPLYQYYYCKICGETLVQSESMEGAIVFEGDQPIVKHNVEEGLREYIWKNTNQVVRNFVEFKEAHSNKYVNNLITNITFKLYDFINLIEKKLIKSKTSSIEEIEHKKKLFTIIYIYAMLIKIVFDNYTNITFVKLDKKGFVKSSIDKLIKYSVDKIVNTQNLILNKLTDIDENFLESSLIKAYKNISLVIEKSKLEPPPEIDLATTLALDPIYLYIAHTTLLSHIIKDKIQPKEIAKVKKLYEESYKMVNLFNVPGKHNSKSLSLALAKDDYIYQRVIEPKFSEKITEMFNGLTNIQKLKDMVNDTKNKSKNQIIGKFYEGYLVESFKKLMEYVHSKIYLKPIYFVKIIKDPENENLYTINVNLNSEFTNFDKSIEKLRKGEKILKDINKYYTLPAFSKLAYNNSMQFLESNVKNSEPNLLSRSYGHDFNKKFNIKLLPQSLIDNIKQKDQFHKHKWSIFVYTNLGKYKGKGINNYKDSDLILYSDKDLGAAIHEKEFLNYIIVDQLCKTCLYSINNVEQEIKNPLKIIEEEQLITNFYNYFENKCPESDKKSKSGESVHEFDKDKCKNCGYVKEMYYSKDAQYFDKYIKQFLNETSAKNNKFTYTSINIDTKSEKLINEIYYDVPDFIQKWKPNTNITNELVIKTYDIMQKGSTLKDSVISALKVKKQEYYNMLINIGLVEKIDYDLIINGSENPYKKLSTNKAFAKTRCSKIDLYIKELIFDYTILLNYKNLSVLPLEIKIIVENSDQKEIQNLSKLNNIFDIVTLLKNKSSNYDYFELLMYIKQLYSEDDVKISEFMLEYLYQGIIDIQQHLEKTLGKKTASEFIIYFINKMITIEKTSSKLKESKSAAIEASQKLDLIDDSNMQDHSQTRMYDDLIKGNQKSQYEYDFDYEDPGLDAGGHNINM